MYDEFKVDNIPDDVLQLELEALDELADDVVEAEIEHMTAKEKMDAKKYRESSKGKKALAKYLKKTKRADYHVNKKLSRKMKRVADLRREGEGDEDIDILECLSEDEVAALDTMIDAIRYEFREALSEACGRNDVNPDDMDEASIHHMTSKEKNIAKAYRRSASGKRALARYLKKSSKAGYRVDKNRSKLMRRVADLRRDFEEQDEPALTEAEAAASDELVAGVIHAILSGELDEATDEPCPECGHNPCTCDDDDEYDDDDMDEASIHHMTSKEKNLARAYRNSASGGRALERYKKKISRPGYRANMKLSKKMKKVAALRNDSLMESIDDFFLVKGNFGSLNEDESRDMVAGIKTALQEFLEDYTETTTEYLNEQAEAYLNEEVIPNIIDEANSYLEDEIVPSFIDKIDSYVTYVAESISDELADKKLLVKSAKSEQLEEFTQNLLALIKSDLKILPEQEDALDSYKAMVRNLQNQLSEQRIEKSRLREEAIEAQKRLFVSECLPNGISEATREALSEEIMAIESSTYEGFVRRARAILEEHLDGYTRKKPIQEDVSRGTNLSMSDAISRAMCL